MSYGFKISREGIDVGTASGENLQVSSDYSLQKIKESGKGTVIGTPSTYCYGTVAHNLGYVPAFFVWVRDPYITNSPGNPALISNACSYADDTNLYFKVYWNGDSNQEFIFQYFIMVDDGQ